MGITPTYPGVYVQEVPSGVRTIVGVSTSIAVFIGRAKQGPLNEPVLCLNFSDFERVFSSAYAGSDLARAVRLFFMNGGTQCYVMRIADGATKSSVTLKNENNDNVLKVTARSPGVVGDTIRLAVTYNGQHPESTFNLEIFRWAQNSAGSLVKTDIENWTALSMDPNSPRYAINYVNQNSNLVELELGDSGADAADHGYSQSGRPIPEAEDEFHAIWKMLISGIGAAVKGTSWTGNFDVTTSGTYTGETKKTYTFKVKTAGTVGDDPVAFDWSDGSTPVKTLSLSDSYNGSPKEIEDGLKLTFGSISLTVNHEFKVNVAPPVNCFRISVNDVAVGVDLSGLDFVNDADLNTGLLALTNLNTKIQTVINDKLPVGSKVNVDFTNGPDDTKMLKIESENGDVKIEPATSNDLAVPLMLGTAQGGIEVSHYAQCRPAPNGIVFNLDTDLGNLVAFADLGQDAFDTITIDSTDIKLIDPFHLTTSVVSGAKMYQDGDDTSVTDNCDGVREKWDKIAGAINAKKASDSNFNWSAKVWGSRLALIHEEGGDNSRGTIKTSGGSVDIGPDDKDYFIVNVRYYSLGISGEGLYQESVTPGSDGSAPTLNNYRDAFNILDKEVDLFNLMILPSDEVTEIKTIWGPASNFCQKRRAFLLMDAPGWGTVQEATSPSNGVSTLRIGLVNDHSALFYPRVTINENGLKKNVGASGAIAGLMARIDSTRGVWKAPAGTEANLRGIVGLEYKLSDDENGVLNPRAINTLRVFPNGIVNWGARTMDGDNDFGSEYKYIPVRRLALFMEESLYRGLKWVVFEPNDEPLWAQIRLNVGAFMHNLFRQGAFQGQTPKEAYFVKCDSETTTQNDINLGIVNIWVGFAPLKPAEFVILYLQQMAGQIET